MFGKMVLGTLALCCVAVSAQAQVNVYKEGVQAFQQSPDAWRRQDVNKIEILPSMTDSLGKAAIENISGAEQVFCYQIANRPADYVGYTIDGMAITGFCGVINDELKNLLTQQLFATATNIDFNNAEQCIIKPKLMLRFVRGVDFTDVLISAPCHSIALFYAGKVKAYNFKPGAEILDVMVESFKEQSREFVSPALINQLLPIGVVQNATQQQMVKDRPQAKTNWNEENASAIGQKPADVSGGNGAGGGGSSSGWNKLK